MAQSLETFNAKSATTIEFINQCYKQVLLLSSNFSQYPVGSLKNNSLQFQRHSRYVRNKTYKENFNTINYSYYYKTNNLKLELNTKAAQTYKVSSSYLC